MTVERPAKIESDHRGTHVCWEGFFGGEGGGVDGDGGAESPWEVGGRERECREREEGEVNGMGRGGREGGRENGERRTNMLLLEF